MDGSQGWPQNFHPDPSSQPDAPPSRASANSVQDAQALLANYPMASVNPSHHVARHLSSMTVSAQPPSFVQPNFYMPGAATYPQGNPPPYTEYAQEMSYLGSYQAPNDDNGLWGRARDDAVRLLRDQPTSLRRYSYQDHPNWNPPPVNQSNFQTNPFAQSIFQQTLPMNVYPTPPPPGITSSSSSLAFALGRPTPPKQVYMPQESSAFMNNFFEQKSREMAASRRPVTPPPKTDFPAVRESPDPLSFSHGAATTSNVTPRKRKVVVQIESPDPKRIQSVQSLRPSQPGTPRISSAPPPKLSATSQVTTPKRSQSMAYVAVPSVPWATPTSSRKSVGSQFSVKQLEKMKMDDSPDLGGYGSDDDDSAYSPLRNSDTVKSSARRTGDRDERVPLEKLTSLIEELFEAEDTLPLDIDPSDLPSEFFSSHTTTDTSRPLLNAAIIRKLIKFIGQVARPVKRIRTGLQSTPRGKGRMAEVDTQVLSRLLKMMERNVKVGEDLDPFRYSAPVSRQPTASPSKRSPKKAARGKRNGRSKSRTPAGSDDELNTSQYDSNAQDRGRADSPTQADFEKLTKVLDLARDSVAAADCCMALLASDRLTKQLYSEELITACLNTVKNQLTKIIYPFVEASADLGINTNAGSTAVNPLLYYAIMQTSSTAQTHRRQLGEIFQALSAVLPRINNLVNAESVSMSDAIIIQAVYIAIGPFFVVEQTGGDGDTAGASRKKGDKGNVILKTFGKSAMRGLRLDALALMRSIFANHEDQRSWIIEEILSSLIKLSDTKQKAGQFRLRDGRSIRTVSALLLQLVQTSAHDVRIEAKKIDKARQNRFALKRQESLTESQMNSATPEPFLDDIDLQEIQLYSSGLESATKAAGTIILFLTQRSGKGKATKNSNEAEYRAIFDNLISDLLTVLYWPEWPAASLLLSMASRFMLSSLDDVKTSQTDSNAAKTIALDHLGVIAARIRSSVLKFQQNGEVQFAVASKAIKPLDEILTTIKVDELEKLLATHKDIAAHLSKRSSEDQACDSARELRAATLGQELASALKKAHSLITDPGADDDLNLKDRPDLEPFGQKIKNALRDVWKEPATDVFDIGSPEEVIRIDRIAEEIGTIQNLKNLFQQILNTILHALDAPPIFMRTKALRALGQIVTSDSTILATPNVRRSIERHLIDSSPAVRDAAVELIGKYMVDSPAVAGDYYSKIADRIADTGLGVRKRVIKLLKSFYTVADDTTRRIDIATRIILRMLDEDETVKDLAIKTIEELWFSSAAPLPSTMKSRPGVPPTNNHDKTLLQNKVAVIMGTAANFKDRQSPLEDLLHKIMAEKSSADAASLNARYTEICEILIDGLVDASDLPGFTVFNCIRTIHLFTSAHPAVLSGSNASTLLPYLKNATTAEGQVTSEYLLKVFRSSIPYISKTAVKFAQELQTALQPMIIKPSGGGTQVLQESVACMCAVVQYLTHDYTRLVNLLKSCKARLQEAINRPISKEMSAGEVKALSILILIIALLGEHCNFDHVRIDHAELAPDINSISQGSIVEHIYDCLLQLYEKYGTPALRGRILQCLGFLFRAQPTLMTAERSSIIMDAIFTSPEDEGRSRLLKIIQEFLTSEAAKHSAKEKGIAKGHGNSNDINMDELVGNTDGFADSGVSSAIVQRYLNFILDAALSQHPQTQATAIDILSFTVKQGLAHPLQSFPIIVALETSSSPALSNRASALHATLHGKHATLLNTRYIVSARMSFDYQKKVVSGPIQGFRLQPAPVALLQRWYSLVREKRPARQDFLKSLAKAFHENPSSQLSQDDVDFTRYMAENFSAFDYKTQEEVFTIIKYLTTVLSTTGMQLLEAVSPSHLLTHLHNASHTTAPPELQIPTQHTPDEMTGVVTAASNKSTDLQERISLMRSSVIIAMVMLLKAHLKTLYSLSEDKCNKFSLAKKSAIGDKPAIKRHENPISWNRLPFALAPVLTSDDVEVQKARFLEIWNEDGLTAEPEDDFL